MTYLDEQKSRVEAIERGEGIQAFRIVAPAADESASAGAGAVAATGDDWSEDDFEITPAAPASSPAADDDIPF